MRNVAAAPCIALEPDRRSADIQSFESELRRRIVGQDHAIDSLVSALQTVRAGWFPSGVDSTRSWDLRVPARPDPSRRLQRYCSEDRGHHQNRLRRVSPQSRISKLIGSPPGYIGHRETPAMLSQARLDEWHTAG
jgi:hypothetical protein